MDACVPNRPLYWPLCLFACGSVVRRVQACRQAQGALNIQNPGYRKCCIKVEYTAKDLKVILGLQGLITLCHYILHCHADLSLNVRVGVNIS